MNLSTLNAGFTGQWISYLKKVTDIINLRDFLEILSTLRVLSTKAQSSQRKTCNFSLNSQPLNHENIEGYIEIYKLSR